MKMLKNAAFAACLLLPSQLLGWDIIPDEIRVPLGSRHVNNEMDVDLNEINPGFALTWNGGRADITAGSLRNSFRNTAAFVTVSRDFWQGENCSAAGFIGTAHYPELSDTVQYQYNGWIPVGGLHTECGPFYVQAMPGRGLIGGPSGKAHSDVILVFGLTLDLGR